ncbi:hypothetical protein [Xiamenia xianingshaonis]|uniref:Uncharacterized protein n=1 Tax=Xiamenia xianingshaonis TaxID=2682776 RepID=A0A9E6MR78_9ACTN|nr:hypothetical protein [Xiamenia xianingshaonis]NHM14429.1 hypothetical protein [Xiamenia xianingshaonis]QTU84903.1 hypothetical protein J7S26_03055 [Xiamenia xianingshaonis]
MEKHLYDEHGNYAGKVSDVGPSYGASYLHVGPEEFKYQYQRDLERAEKRLADAEKKICEAQRMGDRLAEERARRDRKYAKENLRFVKSEPSRRFNYQASNIAGKIIGGGCLLTVVFLVLSVIVCALFA